VHPVPEHEDVADAAVDLAVELVRVESVNPGLVAGAPGEARVVDLLARRLAGSGFEVRQVAAPTAPGRPSLLARRPGRGGGRSLLLNGHVDTVGVDGMTEPFAGRIEGDRRTGRLLGRGACDMKAGVAALVVAAEAAAARDLDGDLVLALVCDEEDASAGTEAVLRDLGRGGGPLPDACLVGEPTWLDLAVAHRGYAVVEVTFTGRAGHSSQPGLGVNAVTHLGRLLTAVEAHDAHLAGGPAHPLTGTGSLLPTVARGGSSAFVLAPTAQVVIERRTAPGEASDVALAEVEALLRRMHADDEQVQAFAVLTNAREAWERDVSSPAGSALARALAGALEAHGRSPAEVGLPYWMESALFEAAGIPTVVCGPAGGGLHAADEWMDLQQLRTYASALTDTVQEFCGTP
jgi:acetylornithine deacetylase